MAQREIVTYPDKRLREACREVTVFDDNIKILSEDMFDTMYQGDGIGLAASQIGENIRIIVMDVPEVSLDPEEIESEPQSSFKAVLINPVITASDEPVMATEGCLSVPDYRAEVERFNKVTVRYQNVAGEFAEYQATGLPAVCIQHEIDHLDGKLFIDKLSRLKRELLKKKFTKLKRKAEH